MKEFVQKRILPGTMRFVSSAPIMAIRDGFVATMGLTIVGSIFLLLAYFPYTPIQDWFAAVGVRPVLLQAYDATFNVLALVAVMAIGYSYAKQKGVNAIHSAILSLVTYILLIDYTVKTGNGESVTGVISFNYLGARGMVASILVGLSVGSVYSYFVGHNITIKMPKSVPEGVSSSFTSIIPGAVIITGATVLFAVFRAMNTTFIDFIYTVIQYPLQGMTSSLPGAIAMAFFISFLWWFGVHGSMIVSGIMAGIITANMNANQALIDAGKTLNIANGGHVVTYNYWSLILIVTGSGITIGIVLYMLFFAKSQQFKQLGRLSIAPAIFNINEPILFGTPIVLNPILMVPFILVPVLAAVVSYFAMSSGLVPLFSAINPPWTTPVVISGLIAGGWRMALLQVVILAISIVVYFPFIRYLDRINYEKEQGMSDEEILKAEENR